MMNNEYCMWSGSGQDPTLLNLEPVLPLSPAIASTPPLRPSPPPPIPPKSKARLADLEKKRQYSCTDCYYPSPAMTEYSADSVSLPHSQGLESDSRRPSQDQEQQQQQQPRTTTTTMTASETTDSASFITANGSTPPSIYNDNFALTSSKLRQNLTALDTTSTLNTNTTITTTSEFSNSTGLTATTMNTYNTSITTPISRPTSPADLSMSSPVDELIDIISHSRWFGDVNLDRNRFSACDTEYSFSTATSTQLLNPPSMVSSRSVSGASAGLPPLDNLVNTPSMNSPSLLDMPPEIHRVPTNASDSSFYSEHENNSASSLESRYMTPPLPHDQQGPKKESKKLPSMKSLKSLRRPTLWYKKSMGVLRGSK